MSAYAAGALAGSPNLHIEWHAEHWAAPDFLVPKTCPHLHLTIFMALGKYLYNISICYK